MAKRVYDTALPQLGLLVMRNTGMRVDELIRLPLNCTCRDVDGNPFLKVPLGKLNSERLVPIDDKTNDIVERLKAMGPVDLYGDAVQIFAGRHHARFIPEDVPQHVISRVFQGRCLLRSGKKLNNIIASVMAKAASQFSEVVVYAYAFVSNHMHLQLKAPSHQVADFIGYLKREITTRWGHDPDIGRRRTMWEEYLCTALPTEESQIRCLKYILSHGVKEKLVSRCHQLLAGTFDVEFLVGAFRPVTRCQAATPT